MSRWIEELPDETYKEEIADPNGCRYKYAGVCCNDRSEWDRDYPDEEECKKCQLFEQEEMNMGDCMIKERREYIEEIQRDCMERTNMTEQEAWNFAFRCWQLGYVRKEES